MEGNQRECAEMAETPYLQGLLALKGLRPGRKRSVYGALLEAEKQRKNEKYLDFAKTQKTGG